MNGALINLFEAHELILENLMHALVLVLTLIHSDQRLVAFELLEEGVGGIVDEGDDFYYFSHYLVLDYDVAFGFYYLYVHVVTFVLVDY